MSTVVPIASFAAATAARRVDLPLDPLLAIVSPTVRPNFLLRRSTGHRWRGEGGRGFRQDGNVAGCTSAHGREQVGGGPAFLCVLPLLEEVLWDSSR